MSDFKSENKLDYRDEAILMIVAIMTPLAVLPVLLGM